MNYYYERARSGSQMVWDTIGPFGSIAEANESRQSSKTQGYICTMPERLDDGPSPYGPISKLIPDIIIGVLALIILFVLVVGWPKCARSAEPGWYVMGAAGRSELHHSGENKWWIQDGFPYSIHGGSSVWLAGAGYRWSRYFAAEITGGSLGRYHHSADFLVDESLYDPTSPTLCRTPSGGTPACPVSHGELRGTVRAWHLSLLPTYPITEDLILYAKFGLTRYSASFSWAITPEGWATSMRENRWTQHFGVGAAWRGWFLEAIKYPRVEVHDDRGSPVSAYRYATTIMGGYRWIF